MARSSPKSGRDSSSCWASVRTTTTGPWTPSRAERRSSGSSTTPTAARTSRLVDVGGAVLVVSQFTLYADTRRGRRPGFTGAAAPVLAERFYLRFADALRNLGVEVATGRFGAVMKVELVNDGPFTIWLDTAER